MEQNDAADEYDREDTQEALYGSYDSHHPTLDSLSEIHNGATSLLALLDQATDDEGDLPDDLSTDTKRRITTAETNLRRALSGIEKTAQQRLNDDSDDE